MKDKITLLVGWLLFLLCFSAFLFCVWCIYEGHGSKPLMVLNSAIFGINTLFMVKFRFWSAF